jgi:hypothetical protein
VKARAVVLLAAALVSSAACRRQDAATVEQQQAQIHELQRERDALRERVGDLIEKDPRLQGMPRNNVRLGVPTSLATTMIERVLTGVADRLTLQLKNLHAHKQGAVKKIVTIGTYDLDVHIVEVKAHLRTGQPEVKFGGDQVAVTLPVTVARGTGMASVHFKWDGRNVSGAVCGDMDVTREVDGGVKPATCTVRGTLQLASAHGSILARPRFPETRVRLEVVPSAESWASVQALLDDKRGVCGYVLDKVDIPQVLSEQLGKGFSIRLPVEKLKPVAVPIGIQQQLALANRSLAVHASVGDMAITERSIWLGADVTVGTAATGAAAPAKP